MSRSIAIGYRRNADDRMTYIKVRSPYDLLGTQGTSMRFWSILKLKEIGIIQLTLLGVCDPVSFDGWENMAELGHEITLLQQNLETIAFDPEIKAQWLSHLIYCYFLLIQMAPKDSIPVLTIG